MLMRIKSKTQDSDDKIREKMIIYTFRQVFHDSAVLYQDGKEQYNGTKYEFDLQNIRNLTKNKQHTFKKLVVYHDLHGIGDWLIGKNNTKMG